MARNDPTETGGLFVGRRPGTAPVRYRAEPVRGSAARQRVDGSIAAALLALETVLCLSLWGPQPLAWLWVGSQLQPLTGSVSLAIGVAFGGMIATLLLTLTAAKRVDSAWKLARRAAGHDQKDGAITKIFTITAVVCGAAFTAWFLLIAGPGPSLAPQS